MIDTIEQAVVELKPAEVVAQLKAYRALTKAHASRTDKLMLKALNAAKKGRRIFDLTAVMAKAGLDEQLRPKLAIARADWTDCYVQRNWLGFNGGDVVTFRRSNDFSTPGAATAINLPRGTFTNEVSRARAVVPIVPAPVRPVDALENYWVLWEAEWQDMPKDPYLLKRIETSLLFVIVAQWDLSELERMVMRSIYRAPRR